MIQILVETSRTDVVQRIEEVLPEDAILRVLRPGGDAMPPEDSYSSIAAGIPELTDRQQDILPLLLQSLSNKQIGRSLGLSPFTVRNHVSQLLRLLDVPSRKAAIAKLAPHSCPIVHPASP